jgi:hypothetical protein
MMERVAGLGKYFYLFMSLLIAGVVVYGFGRMVDRRLIHAMPQRPVLLFFHATVFSGWVVFLILQSALVRMRNVGLHRMLGWFGVALGASVPIVGVSTVITMAHFNILHFHSTDEAAGLIVSLFDMAAFSLPFILAICLRRKPEFHRRLMLVATCALTSAAFARFPPFLVPPGWFYGGVDLLILLCVTRDLVVDRKIHRVYLFALPAFILGQCIAVYTAIHALPVWMKIANAILG